MNANTPGNTDIKDFPCDARLLSEDDIFIEKVIKDLLPVIGIQLDEGKLAEKVASHSGCSRWYFQRSFKKVTGESVSAYIRERRLLVVAHELIRTDKKLIDIATEQGFSTQQILSRLFRERFGITTSTFRKRSRLAAINSSWLMG